MPRWVLEVPKTETEQLLAIAAHEDVSARQMLVWIIKEGIAKRLRAIKLAESSAA